MNGCIYRTKDGECDLYAEGGKFKAFCDMDGCKGRRLSNGDKIRAMSDEELAELIGDNIDCCICKEMHSADECPRTDVKDCYGVWLDWLKSPVEPGEVDNG